jgi:WD40 repeat protein
MISIQPKNPSASFYVTGGTLRRDAPSYVSRTADEELFASLRAGEFSYILTSRQMGKSSLMVRTRERLHNSGIEAITIDLTSLGQNLTLDQWYNGLIEKLGGRLDLEDAMEDYLQNKSHLSPLQRWHGALTDVVLKRINKPVVIFIDEIDVVRGLPFSTDEFFAGIREFYNRRTEDAALNRLTFGLLGVASPSDLIRDTRMTPFNIGNRIELRDFEVAQAVVLARGLGRDERPGRALIDRVIYWTGGHPYLTQRLCQAISKDPSVMKATDVDRLCDDLFFSSRAKEGDDNLAFVRERMLDKEVNVPSLLDLYSKVWNHDRVRDDETNQLVTVLRLSGITRVQGGYLEVRNRIYHRVFDKAWIVSHMPDAELRRQRAALIKGRIQTAAIASVILALMLAMFIYALAKRNQANEASANLIALGAKQIELETKNQELQQNQAELEIRNTQLAAEQAELERKKADIEEETKKLQAGLIAAQEQRQSAMSAKDDAEAKAEAARKAAEVGIEEGTKAKALVNRQLYAARTNLAQTTLELGDIALAVDMLNGLRLLSPSDASGKHDFEWDYLYQLTHSELQNFEQKGEVRAVAYSPDGKFIVTVTDSLLTIYARETEQRWSKPLESEDTEKSLVFIADDSGDNAKFVIADHNSIWIGDASSQQMESLHLKSKSTTIPVISPDGKIVAVSGEKGYVTLLLTDKVAAQNGPLVSPESPSPSDLSKAGEVKLGKHDTEINNLVFSPDGRFLVSTDVAGGIKLWNIKSKKEEVALKQTSLPLSNLIFSSDSHLLLVRAMNYLISYRMPPQAGRERGKEKGLRTEDGLAKVLEDKAAPAPNAPTQSTDSNASSQGAKKNRPDTQKAKPVDYMVVDEDVGEFASAAFSHNGKYLATAEKGGTVKIWNAANFGSEIDGKDSEINNRTRIRAKTPVAVFRGHTDRVVSLSFSPDDKLLLSGSVDKTAKVWDISATHPEYTVLTEKPNEQIYSVAFSTNGSLLAVGGGLEEKGEQSEESEEQRDSQARETKSLSRGFVRLFDVTTQTPILLTLPVINGSVNCLAFSQDGSKLVYGSGDRKVRIFDIPRNKTLTLRGHLLSVWAVAFSPDGKMVASASADHTVKLWDVNSGSLKATLKGHTDCVEALAFSEDGELLASGGRDKKIRIWNVSNSDLLSSITPKEITPVFKGGIAEAGITALTFAPPKITMMLESTASQRNLIAGFANGEVRIFDADACTQKANFNRIWHKEAVRQIVFSPHGNSFATASKDGNVKLWDVLAMQETLTLRGQKSGVWSVAFAVTPSGAQIIATAGEDGTVKLWNPYKLKPPVEKKSVAQRSVILIPPSASSATVDLHGFIKRLSLSEVLP